ncbi:MAG: HAD family hydrolase [Lachnospiraceae bacterium]|nr:HAD family hydrolase [Lachnospiraceae bacterium]
MERRLFIFTDSGDTFIDEGTEIRDERGIVVHAELIPGAGEALRTLYERGYRIALVADGEEQSFTNVYLENGLGGCFCTRTISEIVGVQKPAAAMFQDAMEKNGLTEEDKKRIIMVGNNIRKDVAGANRFGITSVLLDWSPRYNMIPANDEERADYIIHQPSELPELVEKLERRLNDVYAV